jgi:hypothetical protein
VVVACFEILHRCFRGGTKRKSGKIQDSLLDGKESIPDPPEWELILATTVT